MLVAPNYLNGYEILSKKEMESLIQKYDDPERIYNELPSGHE
jgi:hypothetical protein